MYRILPELDAELHDIPRNEDGTICDGYNDYYIKCRNNCKIYHYGKNILVGYIPSIGRGHNILKKLTSVGLTPLSVLETDSEVEFKFYAYDIKDVAEIMQASSFGADIPPTSSKNLPKSDVKIPTEQIDVYKSKIDSIDKSDLLIISRITNRFLESVLQKKYKRQNKSFNYKIDMKKLKMSRQPKEYIWTKNMWSEYLKFLEAEIVKYNEEKK